MINFEKINVVWVYKADNFFLILHSISAAYFNNKKKGKVIPLHAMEALGVRGGIAPTHS
jgi:hypothetical protein